VSRPPRHAFRLRRLAIVLGTLVVLSACTGESPQPSPSTGTTATATSSPSAVAPTASPTAVQTPMPTPTSSPEPSLALELPGTTDPRAVSAQVTPQVGSESGTLTVTVTSAATDRIDELVLRWHDGLDASLRLAPFTPSEERIREGGPPLHQEWTRWVIGPGEQGEPAGTISVGWGPLLPGATLTIALVATRTAPGPVAFDLQLLSGNDLLTLGDGGPAELRVEVP
jgi:hypothetical protein